MEISGHIRKMTLVILALALGIIAIGAAVHWFVLESPAEEIFSFALGVLLTTALNIIKAFMLGRTVKTATEKGEAAANYVRIQHLLRLLLTAGVLVAAALVPFIDLIGACVGLISFHLAMHSLRFSIANEVTQAIEREP